MPIASSVIGFPKKQGIMSPLSSGNRPSQRYPSAEHIQHSILLVLVQQDRGACRIHHQFQIPHSQSITTDSVWPILRTNGIAVTFRSNIPCIATRTSSTHSYWCESNSIHLAQVVLCGFRLGFRLRAYSPYELPDIIPHPLHGISASSGQRLH